MPNFVTYPDPQLSVAAQPRPVDAAMRGAATQLLAAAQEVQAYGLAAAHLGVIEPLIVVSFATDQTQRDYRVLYNPVITKLSDDTVTDAEGSVSMPGIQVPIARATSIELTYDDVDGIQHSERFEAFVARVIQHELDQMNGVFFLTRLSRLKRDTAIRKFEKSRR